MDSARPFRAFVSYCHKDKAFAAWLQRKLEAYRLPRRLADKVKPLPGQAAGRIGPVFRDREDLSAATDLSAAVREAIAASSALVVVASPDAAKSQWVAREIALFRELHPDSLILVALARGEPHDALPEVSHDDQVEPLCADFRKTGDGKRLAFLKIVAGLSGLRLDALVQRDAQRRLRTVMAVTFGAVVLMLTMTLMLVMAVQARSESERQRSEAERQRAAAEGMVEYMLTDLRERLRGVGRLDVMSAVNERAMVYYAAQGDLTRLPDESLQRRAKVLHAMGEDDFNRGKTASALRKFAEAHRTTAATLRRHPTNGDAIYAHAQSEFWSGYAALSNGDRVVATHHWRQYLRLAHLLAQVEARSTRALMEIGFAEGGLCDLAHRDSHDLRAAAAHCLSAIRFEEAALAREPTNRKIMQDLANRHGWMARVHLAQKDYAAALASREAEIRLMDQLLRQDRGNAEYVMRRTWADVGMATILMDSARPERAVELLRGCWAAFEPHLASSTNSQFWESGLRILFFLSAAEKRTGGRPALGTIQLEKAYMQRFLQRFPTRKAEIAAVREAINREGTDNGKD